MSISKLLLPYDIYERHKKIGEFIEDGENVLDVGGELDQLSNFCNPSKITVANLQGSQEKSDVIIKTGKLPFKDGSFETVCAIDVLEHIGKKDREKFVSDLYRVCSKKAILSFPMGTNYHINYEKQLAKWLEKKGMDVTYLKEHIALGLPTKQEIDKFTKGKRSKVYYSGNITISEILFKIHIFDPHIKFVRKLIFLKKKLFNAITNDFFYVFLANRNLSNKVVRAYLIIYKDKKNNISAKL
ncbi:MAG TPA: methyltransferase domain-containing protein [Candidatus Saccharimonadales bacterium]|nr:methyltransferase domain-containing protein [Candidatus Saccharimonadales bacterium]